MLRKLLQYFLKNPEEAYKIKELSDILISSEIKDIIIINSNFYIDNEKALVNKEIYCYDNDLMIYDKNKKLLKDKGVKHDYLIDNAPLSVDKTKELLIYQEEDINLCTYLDPKYKIEKRVHVSL